MLSEIESTAIKLIIMHGREEAAVSAIERALDQAEQYQLPDTPTSEDLLQFYRVFGKFHDEIINAAGNNWLVHLSLTIKSALARYQMLYLKAEGARNLSILGHSEMIKHIREGNPDLAIEALYGHVDQVVDLVKKHLVDHNNNE